MLSENMFKMGLGLLALAIHKKAMAQENESGHQNDPDEFTRQATTAMAPYIVTVIRRLGGAEV